MKKFMSFLLTILVAIQTLTPNIYAKEDCDIPDIDINEINFEEVKRQMNPVRHYTQKLSNKTIELLRYEGIPHIEKFFNNKIKEANEELVKSWNSQVSPEVLKYAGLAITDILQGKYGIDANSIQYALYTLKGKIEMESLTDEEKIASIKSGKLTAEFAGATISAVSAGLGVAAAKAVGLGTATIATTAATAGTVTTAGAATTAIAATGSTVAKKVGGTVAKKVGTAIVRSCATPIIVGGAVAILAGWVISSAYNKFKVEPQQQKAIDGFNRVQSLYEHVKDNILHHDWIKNNLLIMSTSSVPECNYVDTRFHNVNGITYAKTQDEINEDFAEAECMLCGYKDYKDCIKKAFDIINCVTEKKLGNFKFCEKNEYCINNKGDNNKNELE